MLWATKWSWNLHLLNARVNDFNCLNGLEKTNPSLCIHLYLLNGWFWLFWSNGYRGASRVLYTTLHKYITYLQAQDLSQSFWKPPLDSSIHKLPRSFGVFWSLLYSSRIWVEVFLGYVLKTPIGLSDGLYHLVQIFCHGTTKRLFSNFKMFRSWEAASMY